MLLLTLACYTPPVALDTGSYPEQVVLSGDVVLAQGGPDQPGNGHVLLYDATDPPPPNGTGSPVNFATFGASSWTWAGPDTGHGAASAEWAMTAISEGSYLLTALIDNDGDFKPFPANSDVTGGATCGDQVGAYVASAASSTPSVLTLTPPERVDGLTLLVGAPLETERPAFTTDGVSPVFDPTISPDPSDLEGSLQTLTLRSTGIDHDLLQLNSPQAAWCPTTFTLGLKDLDGDGAADPYPDAQLAALGALDMWPLVLLVQISDASGEPVETPALTQMLVSPFGVADETPVNTPFASDTLSLMFLPQAQRTLADGTVEVLAGDAFPRGSYQLVVINQSGQLWAMPNSLAAEIPSQGTTVVVQ
ncbi:MAG: hypothetical protein VX899_19760 [Myxococcota bacterium]|nr:hypothetical protein [Myxococcota bacterium]